MSCRSGKLSQLDEAHLRLFSYMLKLYDTS